MVRYDNGKSFSLCLWQFMKMVNCIETMLMYEQNDHNVLYCSVDKFENASKLYSTGVVGRSSCTGISQCVFVCIFLTVICQWQIEMKLGVLKKLKKYYAIVIRFESEVK